MSYDGGLNSGLIGDFDAIPDLDELPGDLEAALAELAAAAGVEHAPPDPLRYGRGRGAMNCGRSTAWRRPARGKRPAPVAVATDRWWGPHTWLKEIL